MAFQRIENSYCVRESNLAIYFLLILVVYLGVFFFNIITDFKNEAYLPTYNLGGCVPNTDDMESGDYNPQKVLKNQNYAGFWFESMQIFGLMICAYNLKHIPREFSIMAELFAIIWIRLIASSVRNLCIFWHFNANFVTHVHIVYVMVVFELMCMAVTGLYTLRLTFKPN